MNKEMKRLLKEAYEPPKPLNKERFLKSVRPESVSLGRFVCRQVMYIRKTVWLFMIALVCVVVLGVSLGIQNTERTLMMLMPFMAAIAVMESIRSKRFNMTELEMVTRFSLKSVIFARMTILGIAALMILCIASPLIALSFGGETVMTAVRVAIPYLLAMVLSLLAERSPLGKMTEYSSLAIAAMISFTVFLSDSINPAVVSAVIKTVERYGILIALVLLVLTVYEQYRIIKNAEAFA